MNQGTKRVLMKNKFKIIDFDRVEIIIPYSGKLFVAREFRTTVDFKTFYQLALTDCRWYLNTKDKGSRVYVRGMANGQDVYLHRHITNCPDDLVPHHKDYQKPRAGLDNRLSNLELITERENRHYQRSNKSGRVGVSYIESEDRWYAKLSVDGNRLSKHFVSMDAAVKQRQAWELAAFGELTIVDEARWKAYVAQAEELRRQKRGESA